MILEVKIMGNKSTREILLIKEKYGIADDDPTFAILDVYGTTLQDLFVAIGGAKELTNILFNKEHEIKDMVPTIKEMMNEHKLILAQEGLRVKEILTQEMQKKLKELFAQIDNNKLRLEQENKLLKLHKDSAYSGLKNLFQDFSREKEAQNQKNSMFSMLISVTIVLQLISIFAFVVK